MIFIKRFSKTWMWSIWSFFSYFKIVVQNYILLIGYSLPIYCLPFWLFLASQITLGFQLLLVCCAVVSRSVVSDSLRPHGLQPVACQAPLSMGFARQEYWSGLPFLPPGDLPNPGIEPRAPTLQVDSLLSEPPGKPKNTGVGDLFLLQGNFATQELSRGSAALQVDSLPAEPPGKPLLLIYRSTVATAEVQLLKKKRKGKTGFFKEQFQVYNKIEREVHRFLIYPCSQTCLGLSYYQHH